MNWVSCRSVVWCKACDAFPRGAWVEVRGAGEDRLGAYYDVRDVSDPEAVEVRVPFDLIGSAATCESAPAPSQEGG